MTKLLNDKDINRLRNAWALADSPVPGKADAAVFACRRILAANGKTMDDLPDILRENSPVSMPSDEPAPPQSAASFSDDFFAGVDDRMEEMHPGYKAERAAKQAKQAADKSALRRSLIAKHGSFKAATAPNAMERAVNDAVAQFARKVMYKFSNGTFPTDSLDGWAGSFAGIEPPPEHVAAAVRNALPLPTTIAEGKEEYDAWQERRNELGALWKTDDPSLSIGCDLREKIIEDMLHEGLRAVSIEDAIVRHRALIDREFEPSKAETEAMLADLVHLAAQQKANAAPGPDRVEDETIVSYQKFRDAGQKRQAKPVKRTAAPTVQQRDFGF